MFNIGYDRGFDAGWDAAVRRMGQVLQQGSPPEPERAPPPSPEVALAVATDLTAKDVVLEIVRRKPGLRGRDIVQETDKSQKLNERTVRTALYRLKVDGLIYVKDGLWHPLDPNRLPAGGAVESTPAGSRSNHGGA